MARPILSMTGSGVAFRFHDGTAISTNAGAAIEHNDAVYSVASDGTLWKYSSGIWAQRSSGVIDATTNIVQLFFIDSNGNIYISWDTGTGAGKLYRSADDGVNFTAAITFTNADNYASPIAEADNGNLFVGSYTAAGGSEVKEGYKSTDGGATWVDITAAITAAQVIDRHIHGFWWCPYRNLLFCVTGDAGASSSILVSSDYAVSWSVWTASEQATGMAFSPSSIFYCADSASDRKIYRAIVGNTLAEVIASTPSAVYDPIVDGGVASEAAAGFAWWGMEDNKGNIIFPYGKSTGGVAALMVSADDGDRWEDLLAGTTILNWAHHFVEKSHYLGVTNSRYHNTSGAQNYLMQWSVYNSGDIITVDEASGNELSVPYSKIPDIGLPDGAIIKLLGDYAAEYSPGTNNLLINKNGYDFTGYPVTGTLAIDEDFEGVSSLTASTTGTATLIQNDVNPYEGSQNALATLPGVVATQAKLQELNTFSTAIDDDDCWMDMRFSWNSASNPTVAIRIMRILGSVSVYVDGDGALFIQLDNGSNNMRQRADDAVAFTKQQYVHIKLRSKISATAGEVDLWQDGQLVISAKGVNTKNAVPTHAQWDFFGNFAISAYYDLCRASINIDPDKPATETLNGSAQKIIPEGIYS